jgi:hypothetical protein
MSGSLDLLVVERGVKKIIDPRDDKSIFVSLPGCYALEDRASSRDEPRLYACRAVNISSREITLTAPVTADPGRRVTADVGQLGRLRGSIIRVFELGFTMKIGASAQEREVLASKIAWVERHKDFEIPEMRANARFVPRQPLSLLSLADGSVLPCFVVDISVAGAAVSADILPRIGTVLAVGKVVGRVVRLIEEGFAMEFVVPQGRQEVEALVTRS